MKIKQNLSRWTMFIFGILALILGAAGLKSPQILLKMMGFKSVDTSAREDHDYTPVFVTTSSMASFNMGVYYVLAAWFNTRSFFYWTVPFRVVTFSVFTLVVLKGLAPLNFVMVALWELIGALLTGWALLVEKRNQQSAEDAPLSKG